MKRIAALFAMALTAPFSYASEWVEVASAKDGSAVHEYKEGSFDNERDAGNTLATAVFRVTKPKETTNFYKEKVAHSDCRIGYGSLATYSLSNTPVSKVDYVNGGGTVGSAIAQFVCTKAFQKAIRNVIEKALPDIDYTSDSEVVKKFDELYESVNKDPAYRSLSIDSIAIEAHRLVVEDRKKAKP